MGKAGAGLGLCETADTIDEKEVLRLSRELVRIPSIYKQEHRLAKHIASRLDRWGLSAELVPVEGYGPCVVSRLGTGKRPTIVLNGHMDTVEVKQGWKHDPFGATVEKGLLYGLGALDMKCGLAALMIALRAVAESGAKLECDVSFQAVTGEEDNAAGTRTLMSRGEFKRAKAAIVGEGFGGLRAITNGRRGSNYFDIDVVGRSAHGALPHMGVNAVVDASRIVCALGKMKMPKAPGVMADSFRPLQETQTVLKIEGGSHSLSVPEKCCIKMTRFTVPGRSGNVRDELASMVDSLDLDSSVFITYLDDPGNLYLPYQTSSDSHLVKTASKWIRHYTGEAPRLVCGVSEADDNKIAADTGVPVICMGPGETGKMARYHQSEEAISVKQLGTVTKVYCTTILDLAKSAR
jgi:succinyl-diaminopimelate desuccinylase